MTNQIPDTDDIPVSLLADCRALVAEAQALADGHRQWLKEHTTTTGKDCMRIEYAAREAWWDVRAATNDARRRVNLACFDLEDMLRASQDRHSLYSKAELTQKLRVRLADLKQAIEALEQAKAAYIKKDRRYKAKAKASQGGAGN